MLDYTDSAVTRNASEKKINSLLDFISTSTDLDLLQVGQGVDTGSVCAPEGVGESRLSCCVRGQQHEPGAAAGRTVCVRGGGGRYAAERGSR